MKLSYCISPLGLSNKRKTVTPRVITDHSDGSYDQIVINGDVLDSTTWILYGYKVEKATDTEVEILEKMLGKVKIK